MDAQKRSNSLRLVTGLERVSFSLIEQALSSSGLNEGIESFAIYLSSWLANCQSFIGRTARFYLLLWGELIGLVFLLVFYIRALLGKDRQPNPIQTYQKKSSMLPFSPSCPSLSLVLSTSTGSIGIVTPATLPINGTCCKKLRERKSN